MKKSTTQTALRYLTLTFLFFIAFTGLNAQCNASFTYNFGANGAVNFVSTSTGTTSTTHYYWNFNNGQSSNGIGMNTANTTYTTNQIVMVTLHLVDSFSSPTCASSSTQSFVITNAGCNTTIGFSHTQGANGNVSFSPNPNIFTIYNWAFGDGGSSNNAFANHTYTAGGVYTVTLTASTSSASCTYTASNTITVSIINCSLNANFSYTTGPNGSVLFGNTTTGTTSNTNYQWYFGDFNSSTLANPSHTYLVNGTYPVVLYATDSIGVFCTDATTINVTINNAACLNTTNFFITKDSTTALTWNAWPSYPPSVIASSWSWGDGSSTSGMFPSHTYTAAGVYTICLSTTVSCGTNTTICHSSSIYKQNGAMITLNVRDPSNMVGIKEQSNTNALLVFPNPASEEISVRLVGSNANVSAQLIIYDLVGKIVSERPVSFNGDNATNIDLSQLNEGVYFMKIRSGGIDYSQKIILQK